MASDSSDFVLLIKLVLEYLIKLIFYRCLLSMLGSCLCPDRHSSFPYSADRVSPFLSNSTSLSQPKSASLECEMTMCYPQYPITPEKSNYAISYSQDHDLGTDSSCLLGTRPCSHFRATGGGAWCSPTVGLMTGGIDRRELHPVGTVPGLL